MALERRFASYTKEGDQEYSVQVNRVDDAFTCEVYGKFGDKAPIERKFEATGPEAEHQVQEWLYALDEEVRAMMSPKQETVAETVAAEMLEKVDGVSAH